MTALFFIFSILAGLSIGGTLSTSRLVLIELVPERVLNSSFGIYAISERAATIIGPLAWSMVLSIGGYRWAMFSMVVFMVVSVLFMVKVFRNKKGIDDSFMNICAGLWNLELETT